MEGRSISDFQRRLAEIYLEKDSERGLDGTFMYLVSEVGELAEALREEHEDVDKEFADVLAWLLSVANIAGVDVQKCMEHHYFVCPDCEQNPCKCDSKP